MLNMKCCLKISFQGEVSVIICPANSSYNQIIDQACKRFHIAKTQRAGLVLTNDQGYVFEQQLLEYFLLLFPQPELLFYLRLDWQKLRRAFLDPVKRRRRSADDIHDIHEIQQQSVAESDYVAVPVHRQNCFIGALPAAPAAAAVRPRNCLQPRIRQQQPEQPRIRHQQQQQSHPKRIRLQLYNKSRRSVPPAGQHVAMLATAPRSIRI